MSDHVVLTTVPVHALAQPLLDFLASSGIQAYTFDDDTGLDATQGVAIKVGTADETRARELLAAFWADNEGRRDVM